MFLFHQYWLCIYRLPKSFKYCNIDFDVSGEYGPSSCFPRSGAKAICLAAGSSSSGKNGLIAKFSTRARERDGYVP